jgi:restriction system protein
MLSPMAEQIWVVRAGRDGVYLQDFLDKKMVAIGWGRLGDLSSVHGRVAVAELVAQKFPEYTKVQRTFNAGQVYRFRDELVQGSTVVTYDPSTRNYHLGSVIGDYVYRPKLHEELQNTRAVNWKRVIPRDGLSAPTKNRLGSIATIFRISDLAAAEIQLNPSSPQIAKSESVTADEILVDSEADIRKDTEQRALEFLQDKLNELDWSQMQELVAGLLRAMGYKTKISPAGPDRGRDIIASPDGFGFQQPRILVEVKHRTAQIGAPAIRSFTGGLRQGDNGLYISTGGFSKEARYEADRSNHPLTLMDSNDLGEAIIEHYDQMDLDTRTLLPLKKIYWPA